MKNINYTTNMMVFRDCYLVSKEGERFKFTDIEDLNKCIKEATKAICGFLGKGYDDNGQGMKKEEWEISDEPMPVFTGDAKEILKQKQDWEKQQEDRIKKCRNYEHSQMKTFLQVFGEPVAKSYTENSMRLQSKLINSLIAARKEINNDQGSLYRRNT